MSARYNPFKIVRTLELELCSYTGAKEAVCVNSCTNALGLCFRWHKEHGTKLITLPNRTYIGVGMRAKACDLNITFVDNIWSGSYQIGGTEIWDCARSFHNGMFYDFYGPDSEKIRYKCLSFHRTKILGHIHGGAILTNNSDFAYWARIVRTDGRNFDREQAYDDPMYIGEHIYLEPEIAAGILQKMQKIPLYNAPLPNDDYPDLSQMSIFK